MIIIIIYNFKLTQFNQLFGLPIDSLAALVKSMVSVCGRLLFYVWNICIVEGGGEMVVGSLKRSYLFYLHGNTGS